MKLTRKQFFSAVVTCFINLTKKKVIYCASLRQISEEEVHYPNNILKEKNIQMLTYKSVKTFNIYNKHRNEDKTTRLIWSNQGTQYN